MRTITSSGTENISIGVLSKHSGVNIETIRYYERIKMLPAPPRTASGRQSTDQPKNGHWLSSGVPATTGSLLRRFAPCWPWEDQSALRVPKCTKSRAHIWRAFAINSPTSSSLNPSWRKRSRNAPTALPPTARCPIFWISCRRGRIRALRVAPSLWRRRPHRPEDWIRSGDIHSVSRIYRRYGSISPSTGAT